MDLGIGNRKIFLIIKLYLKKISKKFAPPKISNFCIFNKKINFLLRGSPAPEVRRVGGTAGRRTTP
jgi:hypothetical protein